MARLKTKPSFGGQKKTPVKRKMTTPPVRGGFRPSAPSPAPAPAKQYVLEGKSVSQAEFEAGSAKQMAAKGGFKTPEIAAQFAGGLGPGREPAPGMSMIPERGQIGYDPFGLAPKAGESQKFAAAGIAGSVIGGPIKLTALAGVSDDILLRAVQPVSKWGAIGNTAAEIAARAKSITAWSELSNRIALRNLMSTGLGASDDVAGAAAGKYTAPIFGRIAANTKTAGLIASLTSKTGIVIGAAAGGVLLATGIVLNIIQMNILGRFVGGEEAPQTGGIVARDAWMEERLGGGDPAITDIAMKNEEDALKILDEIQDDWPIQDIINAIDRYSEIAQVSHDVRQSLIDSFRARKAAGLLPDQIEKEYWEEQEARRAQAFEDEKAYWEEVDRNKKAADKTEREYWERIWAEKKEREKENKEYWALVKKEQAILRDEMAKSRLKFGLLR